MSRSLYEQLNAAFMRPSAPGEQSPHDQLFKSEMMSKDILVRHTNPVVFLAYLQCMDAYLLQLIKALEIRKLHEAIKPFYESEPSLDGLYANEKLKQAAMTDAAKADGVDESVKAIAGPLLQRLQGEPPIARLIAHTYLRFLGDLHGGMVIYPGFSRKLKAMGEQPGHNMQYLGALCDMGKELRDNHIRVMQSAFDRVPEPLHDDVIEELHAEVGMMAQLFNGLHQLPQQQTQSGSESLLLCAAVVLVVAVGAVWLVGLNKELAFEGLASADMAP